jgi:peptide/nickel transport system substrate-binding protein
MSLIFLNLNNPTAPFFQVPNIRRALLLGLNRNHIASRILQGQAIIADGPILPGTPH